ncbi:ribonuclease H-like domain-containing protein [Tanacetum coccineum]
MLSGGESLILKEEQSTKPDDSTAGEAVTTASVDDSVVPTTIEEITLAQTLIQIKAAKPKVVTTAATTTTTTRPKDKGVVVQEPSEFRVPQETQPSSSKDKGKEEQKLARKQEEEANIALIESWENTQAMMEADRLLAERLQSKEREELTDEEKAKLFMELMEKRRKHFAALRAQEKRNRPPTKAQKRTQMSTYLKHMGGYTYKQLKGKSFDEIQKLFDKEMKRVNTFVAMGSEVQESKEKKEEGREETTKGSRKKMLGRKRAGKEQQKESSKKQRVEEEKESEEVDEVDEAELKKLLVIKKDKDISINAIPLATKLPVIIDYKLHKEGMLVHYQLIRADGSSKRYSSMIRMLQGIDREDLEALWRIVKAKYGDTRPDNEFERVLWGDLKVMFEPDKRSDVWRILQGYRVTIWKLIDSSGVHFVRFDNLHIFMLVEKRYPLTPITITNMLNKKLQTDHQNEIRNLKIQKMNIKFRGGLLGLKRLHGFLEVTAAQVHNGNYAKWFGINKWYQSFALRNFDLEDMELIQDYALWEVIENGNSWVSVSQITKENGKIVTKMSTPATTEEKTKKKNDVKARVVWMNKPEVETMSIDDLYNNFKIVEQKVKKTIGTSSGVQNLAFMTAPGSSSTNDANTASSQDLEQIHEDDLEAMDLKWQLFLQSVRAKKYYQKTGKKIFINGNDIAGYDKSRVECYNCHKLGHFTRECKAPRSKEEEQVQTNMALMAFSDLEVYTDKTFSKTCLKNYETLKKQYDDLVAKQHETEFKEITYKRGLDTVEAQLVTYRNNEVLFSKEVAVLKREVGIKQYEINMLKIKFEKVKQEKDVIDFKIKKFGKASKDLDQLLGSQITDKSKKGFGYSAVPPPHPLIYNRPNKLDLSYSGLDEFKEPEFKGYGPENSKKESNVVCENQSDNSKENSDKSLVKEQVSQVKSSFVKGCGSNTSKSVSEVEPKEVRKNNDALIIEDWVSDDEEQDESKTKPEKKTVIPTAAKIEKPVKKSVRYAEMYRSQSPRGNQRNWNGQKSNQLGSEFVMYNKACFICGSFNHVQKNCTYHQKKKGVSGNNYNRVDNDYYAKTSHHRTHKNMTPRGVLLRTGLKPLSTAKSVYTAHPKPTVHCARPKTHFYKSAQSTVQRPFYKNPALTNRHFNHKVNTVRPRIVNTARSYRTPVNTVRPRVVNTARPNRTSVNAARANGFNAGKPQHDDKGFVDSGCSRHMTGNIAYLSDFKQFDGGYVAFGGGAYGGKISGKGTLKTDNLDFEDANVNAVKMTWAPKLQLFSNSYHLRHCLRGGISQEVGTPRYLSLVVPLTKVGDEAVHKELGDRMERAATTASSLEAEQDSGSGPRCQDTILGDVNAQTRFEITSIQSIDPPLSRGYTLGSGEDSMKLIGIDEIFPKFAETHNVVAFLEKPKESDGFAEIIDFLKASSVSYALTVNPVIYTSCIEQFWATAKVQTVNGVRQIQALVDKKRVIVTESSIRRDLHLNDAEGTDCLPTATIFEELARMGYEKPSQKLTFYKAFFSPQWKY